MPKEVSGTVAVKQCLKDKGTTQKALAEKLGVSHSGLSENINRSRMSLGNFCRILNVLGYDVTVVDRESGEAVFKVFR